MTPRIFITFLFTSAYLNRQILALSSYVKNGKLDLSYKRDSNNDNYCNCIIFISRYKTWQESYTIQQSHVLLLKG